MSKGYVSEFSIFMNQYLDENPQLTEERQRGWREFWMPNISLDTPNDLQKEPVFNDSYGFSSSVWQTKQQEKKIPESQG